MDWYQRETHQQLGAWFNGLYALFNLGGALLFFAVFGGFGLLFGGIGAATLALPAAFAGAGFFFIGVFVAGLIALPFIVNLIAAVGLGFYPDEMWTTVVAVLAAMLSIPVVPIGTLLGMHTLLVVFWDPIMTAKSREKP